jgi:hypothetical protein
MDDGANGCLDMALNLPTRNAVYCPQPMSKHLVIINALADQYYRLSLSWDAGVAPRTMWITIGGFIFFGVYETAKATLGNL